MAPPLPKELEEEILLRFPPHEPELLLRASLVCKRWRRLVTAPAFRRRLRDLHRAPPILVFLCNIAEYPEDGSAAAFVATTAFRAPDAGLGHRRPLDARHGRVLLDCAEGVLVVWNPATGGELELPFPDPHQYAYNWTAAVLCASRGPCATISTATAVDPSSSSSWALVLESSSSAPTHPMLLAPGPTRSTPRPSYPSTSSI